jgi:parallel beta-helix repeat protein
MGRRRAVRSGSVRARGAGLLAYLPLVAWLLAPGCHDGGGSSAAGASVSTGLSTLSASQAGGLIADGIELTTLTVTVRDLHGDPMPGRVVVLAASGTGNDLVQPAAVTDAAGQASGTLTSTVAELKSVTAKVDPGPAEVSLADSMVVEFLADAASISQVLSTIEPVPATGVIASGSDAASITVTLRDGNGNPVAGQVVELAATGSGNVLMQPAGPTDAAGVAVGTLASTAAGSKTISALVNPGSDDLALAEQPTVSFVGDAGNVSASLSALAADPAFGAGADGAEAVTLTATVVDGNGNTLAGLPVSFAVTGASNTVTPDPATTDADGVATAALTTTVAEDKDVTAVIDPGPDEVVLLDAETVSFTWSHPRKRYVRAGGSDANSGESPAQAWGTLGKAAASAEEGTTVYVGGGTYTESVTMTQGGSAAAPVRFLADRTGDRTGDAGDVVIDGAGANDVVLILVDYIVIEGFTVRGASPSGTEGAGIRVGDAPTRGVVLRKNRIHGNRRGIHARRAREIVIEDNVVSNNAASSGDAGGGGEGIYLSDSDDSRLLNNLIYNNEGIGLHLTSGSTGAEVLGNTLYQNGDDQVHVGGLLNDAVVRNNLASEGFADGIQLALGSLLTTSHNDAFGNVGSNFLGFLLGLGDHSLDPVFLDPFGADAALGGADGDDDDFHLDDAASPAFDSGSDVAGVIELSDGTTLADRSSRSDGVLDGDGADGAVLNRGFHYPATTGDLPALEPGHARATYGVTADRQAKVRTRGAAGWGAEIPAPPAADPIRRVCSARARTGGDEELVLVLAEDGAGTEITCLRWSGAAWYEEWTAPSVPAAAADRAACELVTLADGDAIAVWSDGSASPRFREYTQGEWSVAAPVFASAPGGAVAWVRLAASAAGDEATLLLADDQFALRAVTWSGHAWDEPNAATLETALRTLETRAFDLAYESQSGDVLAVWAGPSSEARFATRAGGAPTWSAAAPVPGLGATPSMLDLGAEGTSDRVALAGLGDAAMGAELRTGIWDGAGWMDLAVLDAGAGATRGATAGNENVEVAWSPASGEALVVYADAEGAALHWGAWTPAGGWTLAPDLAAAAVGLVRSVRLGASTATGDVLALVSDEAGQLHAFAYDGAGWSLEATPTTSLPAGAGVPFGLVVER